MSESYSPSGAYPTFPLELPLDGELITHAILVDGILKPTIDAADYANSRVTAQSGAKGASVTRALQDPGLPFNGSTDWSLHTSGRYVTAVNTAAELFIQISAEELPHGVTLTSASVQVAVPAHASIAALTLPTVAIYSEDITSGVVSLGSASDPSGTFTAYSIAHAIPITGLSHVVDRATKRYFIIFTSEHGGGNAAANAAVVGASVTYTAI